MDIEFHDLRTSACSAVADFEAHFYCWPDDVLFGKTFRSLYSNLV